MDATHVRRMQHHLHVFVTLDCIPCHCHSLSLMSPAHTAVDQQCSCRLTRAISTGPCSVRVTQNHQLCDDPNAGRSMELVAGSLSLRAP